MKIDVILLAAGSGRRFSDEKHPGKNKLLHLLGGKPLYLGCFQNWAEAAGTSEGCRIFAVAREQEILDAAEDMGFFPVDSPESANGISYSIHAGLHASLEGGGAERFVFAVADQPLLQVSSLKRFLQKAAVSDYACLAWEQELYNPASFPASALPELMALPGDQGGKRVLLGHLDQCARVYASRREEILDGDTAQEMKELERIYAVYQPDHTSV